MNDQTIPTGIALNIVHAVKRDAARWANDETVGAWSKSFQSIVDRLEMVAPGHNPNLRGVPINVVTFPNDTESN